MSKNYIITCNGYTMYCAVNYTKYTPKHSIIFRNIDDNLRLNIEIDSKNANISIINSDKVCPDIDNFINYQKKFITFIRYTLFSVKMLCPHINKIYVQDFLQIIYNGIDTFFNLSLSYGYMLKYNQTWYQKEFGAELPEYIYKHYINSLQILDEPLMDYSLIKDIYPQFAEYEVEYRTSKSPRDFINQLRSKFKSEFYFKVGPWLNQYMKTLQIKINSEHWYIPISNIISINNFNIIVIDNIVKNKSVNNNSKYFGFHIGSDSNFTSSVMGIYDNK